MQAKGRQFDPAYLHQNLDIIKIGTVTCTAFNNNNNNMNEDTKLLENTEDVLHLNVPLFLRLLEYSRESGTSDVDLHWITERAIDLSRHGYTLTMAHYSKIVPDARTVTIDLPNVESYNG